MGDEPVISLTITIAEQSFRIRVPQDEEERWRRIEARSNAAVAQVLQSGVVGGPRALAMAVSPVSATSCSV
jgi:hypothetical protein